MTDRLLGAFLAYLEGRFVLWLNPVRRKLYLLRKGAGGSEMDGGLQAESEIRS